MGWPEFSRLAHSAEPVVIPDFTKGDAIPAQANHDWNLGATGLRGWMHGHTLVTSDARQIRITKVAEKSPADGLMAVGDVILGVGEKPFSFDPRTEMGQALTAAETEVGGGKLRLIRWRAGKTEVVTLQLPVLGSYSPTAPFDCPKSQRILEQGCKSLAARMSQAGYGNQDPIPRSLNALALLASGDPAYLPLVKKEAEWAATFSSHSMQTWHYGYVTMLLAEYVIATGDQSVMPGLSRLALESAKGQSAVGSWGHGFARPDGRLGGYGMMNSPGLPLTISLVLAREAGVRDPAIDLAIERSARLLRFYIGKGAIPYGDHQPWIENHEDNGKCGMASVLFHLLGETAGTEFFTRMCLASHGPERDTGHTGNFFNMLWAMPGVAHAGPHATGAWMREFGAWYFDLARQWDSSFPHQGPPESGNDSYAGWDCSGAYLLAYAMPLRKIHFTGKKTDGLQPIEAVTAQAIIGDGRGWNNKDRYSYYDALSNEQLIERLGNWSPVVRERAAMAIGRRNNFSVAPLIEMLGASNLEARYGACQGLIHLRGQAAPAVEQLRQTLTASDLWLRIKAAEALASIGKPALSALPDILDRIAREPGPDDPRAMEQRYLCSAVFGKMLTDAQKLEGVDRDKLRVAVARGLQNQDGQARGQVSRIYSRLTFEEIEPLLPAVREAIEKPAPSGEMFADEVRLAGLKLLSAHVVEEGILASADYVVTQNPWASQERILQILPLFERYGVHARVALPKLRAAAEYFEQREPDFPKKLSLQKAAAVRETITKIEAATERPELRRLQ
ncbi:MAG: DUF6288 domain-containing protein [Planctomycetota bacterium]